MTEHNIASISGGKDSTATLLVARELEVPNLSGEFADTGHEHPATYDYVHYLAEATGVPIRWVRADFARQIAASVSSSKRSGVRKVCRRRFGRCAGGTAPDWQPIPGHVSMEGPFPQHEGSLLH